MLLGYRFAELFIACALMFIWLNVVQIKVDLLRSLIVYLMYTVIASTQLICILRSVTDSLIHLVSGSSLKSGRQLVNDKVKTEPGISVDSNENSSSVGKFGKETRTRTKSG